MKITFSLPREYCDPASDTGNWSTCSHLKKIIKSNPLHVQDHSLKHLLYKKKSERVHTPDLFQEPNKNNKSATYPSLGITELPVDWPCC